jgi:hypothetical protein
MGGFSGIIGLVILAVDIWAIVNIFQSRSSMGGKVLWTALIIVLPVLGFILWFFMGPKKS